MLDIKFIRENLEKVKEATKNKNKQIDFDRFLFLDEERRRLITEIEALKTERNKSSKNKPSPEIIEQMKALGDKIKTAEKEKDKIEEEYLGILKSIPNVYSDDTKVGKNEEENIVLRKGKAELPTFNFNPRDHVELGKILDVIDVDKSSEVSGSRFFYLKNEAVLLQFAIIQFVFETLTNKEIISDLAKLVGNPHDKPFVPMLPPDLVKADVMDMMDRLHPTDERYYFEKDNIVFVGSAEHTMGPYHMKEILNIKDLPLRYIGYSSAFRREAGSYGKDMGGILRTHQFDKMEMEVFSQKEHGQAEQDLIVAIQEYLLNQIKIPYQVVSICTGDMGKPDYRQIDIESWIPSQNKYRETHTSDYMTDYQARRLMTRYKDEKGDIQYVHMNDATAFAMGRIIIAILENYQQEDGSVLIPEVLRKYMNGKKIIENKK